MGTVYHIAVLTDHNETGQRLVQQTQSFCRDHGLYPVVELYFDTEHFFNCLQETTITSVIIALPGVAGLNAAEHLRSLHPDCGLIWCSDLDFSLQAFRLRAAYFMMAPPTEQDLREGLLVWMTQKNNQVVRNVGRERSAYEKK